MSPDRICEHKVGIDGFKVRMGVYVRANINRDGESAYNLSNACRKTKNNSFISILQILLFIRGVIIPLHPNP